MDRRFGPHPDPIGPLHRPFVYLAVTGVFLGTDAFISAGRLDRENELEVANVTLSGEVDRLRLAIEREPHLVDTPPEDDSRPIRVPTSSP